MKNPGLALPFVPLLALVMLLCMLGLLLEQEVLLLEHGQVCRRQAHAVALGVVEGCEERQGNMKGRFCLLLLLAVLRVLCVVLLVVLLVLEVLFLWMVLLLLLRGWHFPWLTLLLEVFRCLQIYYKAWLCLPVTVVYRMQHWLGESFRCQMPFLQFTRLADMRKVSEYPF